MRSFFFLGQLWGFPIRGTFSGVPIIKILGGLYCGPPSLLTVPKISWAFQLGGHPSLYFEESQAGHYKVVSKLRPHHTCEQTRISCMLCGV